MRWSLFSIVVLSFVTIAAAAGNQRKQSDATYPLMFYMVSSTDHVSPATGLSCTVTLRKLGGSFASPAGAVSEIANGWYQVAGNATDSNTLGPLLLHATGTGADPADVLYEIVAYDPFAGVTATTVSDKTGYSLSVTPPTAAQVRTELDSNSTKLANLDATISSRLAAASYTAPPTAAQVRTELDSNSTKLANLDATISSRLATAGYTAPDNASIASIASDLGTQAFTLTSMGTKLDTIDDFVDTEVAAIKLTTDHLATTLELVAGNYRFTAAALALAPSGGGGGTLTAGDVWDVVIADHLTAGTAGAKLNAAGAAGNPLTSACTDYEAGSLGSVICQIQALVSGGLASVRSAVASNGQISLIQGDDYPSGQLIVNVPWTGESITGGTAVLQILTAADYQAGTTTSLVTPGTLSVGAYNSGTGTYPITLALTAAETGALQGSVGPSPQYRYRIIVTVSGRRHTVADGQLAVQKKIE